jgi:hypothetical protein
VCPAKHPLSRPLFADLLFGHRYTTSYMGTQSENLNRSVGCLEINYLAPQVEFFPEPLGALAGALALVFGQYLPIGCKWKGGRGRQLPHRRDLT